MWRIINEPWIGKAHLCVIKPQMRTNNYSLYIWVYVYVIMGIVKLNHRYLSTHESSLETRQISVGPGAVGPRRNFPQVLIEAKVSQAIVHELADVPRKVVVPEKQNSQGHGPLSVSVSPRSPLTYPSMSGVSRRTRVTTSTSLAAALPTSTSEGKLLNAMGTQTPAAAARTRTSNIANQCHGYGIEVSSNPNIQTFQVL